MASCGSAVSPGDGSGDGPLHSRPRGQQPSPYGLVQSCAPRRPGPWRRGGRRADERQSGGWASDPHSHPEAALPVPQAGAGPPSQVSATSGRCAADSVFGLRRVRRTGGRESGAEPDRRCRSQGSPTAGGEGAAWRAPATDPLRTAPSPIRAWLQSAADPRRCSSCGSELRTWKIDLSRARASHWSQPLAGSGLGASSGGRGRGAGAPAVHHRPRPPQPNSHYGPAH